MTNIAVVGCGYWGPNLVRTIEQLEGAKLALCCDRDESRLKQITDRFPHVATTRELDDVLNSDVIDAVILATPVRTHYELGMKVLNHGKHLLVEKPLATTAAECQDMIDAAFRDKLTLMAGHLYYYHAAVAKIKEIIDSGALGEVRHIYSERLNLGRFQIDVNAMWSLGPHDVSLAMYLLGESPVEVSATGSAILNEGIEDIVFMEMRFPGGATANSRLSWLHPEKVRKLSVIGTRRMLVYDDTLNTDMVALYDTGGDFSEMHPSGKKLYSQRTNKPTYPEIDLSMQPLARECAHFVNAIRTGTAPLSDGRNGMEVVRVLEHAQRSLETGRPVSMEPAGTLVS
jgi:predicted dehydrogenase